MANGELEIDIVIENVEQFTDQMKSFSPFMKNELYGRFIRIAGKEEKILKGTSDFQDVTGKLRREIYVTATVHPLGIEAACYTHYGVYVDRGHGTYRGGFWRNWKRTAVPRIFKNIERAVNDIVNKFNRQFVGE